MFLRILFLVSSIISIQVNAGQTTIPDYDTARSDYFWKLYSTGGEGVYCGQPVEAHRRSIEHTYPASWMVDFYQENGHPECVSRNNCPVPEYGFAEADLHNMWPAIANVNSSRGNHPFGELDDADNHHHSGFAERFDCEDFERSGGASPLVEPRDASKGELARSLLYMAAEYGFPLKGMKPMLERWNEEDPADFNEMWRNEAIFRLQGTRNRFITESYQRR